MKLLVLFALLFSLLLTVTAQMPDQAKVIAGAERAVERFAKMSPPNAPGCAVGVSLDGKSVFEKGFGMADLEHDVAITPQTIFESGSVAKQFTSAAVIMLSLEGKLSIDDPVRKYIPELPDYGAPLTIRHMLNHTSGIRDWGSVMGLTGAGRGDRMITQPMVIDVITRQKYLDFIPGSEYSYSNSNYNLAADIVERVTKQKFRDFMQERFFKPLGMSSTSIRDDYQRIVPGRAQAYEGPLSGPWRLSMPFMNAYGNGGVLTTVGDWLKWNAMLDSRSMGVPLVDALETQGVLNDGRKIPYALGVLIDQQNGYKRVWHNGSTAGYQTLLSRYPDLKMSVAVLCNSSSRNGPLEPAILTEIMGTPPAATPPPPAVAVSPDELQKYGGLWRDEKTHFPVRTTVQNGALRIGATALRPLGGGVFQAGQTRFTFALDKDGKPTGFQATNLNGDLTKVTYESEWTPTATDLSTIAGTWYSYEADATATIVIDGSQAVITQRPTTRLIMRPQYKDHFTANNDGQVIWFTRDKAGLRMHVGGPRMRDMLFERVDSKK